jgi:hypothetical protein
MPTAIPNVKIVKDGLSITKEVYTAASKLHFDAPITIQVNAAKQVFALSNKAADVARKAGIPVVTVGPVTVPFPPIFPPLPPGIPNPIPRPLRKILNPF